MRTITLTPDKTGYIFIIILFLACAGYGVWISLNVHFLWGLLVALFSGLSAAAFVWWRENQGGPQLIIDNTGIHDLRYGAGLIPWTDIEKAYIMDLYTHCFLCLVLNDPEPYMQRFRNPVSRQLVKGKVAHADMSISLFGLTGADPEEIDAVIRARTAAPGAE